MTTLCGQITTQFHRLTSDDGLLDDIAYSIFQDSKGFIWIGTAAGLQRYDGYELMSFQPDPRDTTNQLLNGAIRHITETSEGTLWIGTAGGGIARYREGVFLPALTHDPSDPHSLSGNLVEDILEDRERGGCWVATKHGLNFYDFESGVFQRFMHDPDDPASLSNDIVFSLLLDDEGNLWCGTRGGLNRYLGEGRFQRFLQSEEPDGLAGNMIHDLIQDREGRLWLALIGAGVQRFDPILGSLGHFSTRSEDPADRLYNDVALNVAEDAAGSIWIATWGGGLHRYVEGEIEHWTSSSSDPTTIGSDNIEELMVDREGNVWTANFMGGVNRLFYVDIVSYPYENFDDQGMLPTSGLWSILQASDGAIWTTSHYGLNSYREGVFSEILYDAEEPNSPSGLGGGRPYKIIEDSKGALWVANLDAGVDRIVDGHVEHFRYDESDPEGIPGRLVCSLEEGADGRIWMGFNEVGVASYYDGRFTHFIHDPEDDLSLSSNNVEELSMAPDGSVWIATKGGGLSSYRNGQFVKYQFDEDDAFSIPTNTLTSVMASIDGEVWVGYVGGVARLDVASGQFENYGLADGLAGSYVEDLDVDNQGQVWVATHNGASRYERELNQFKTYGKKEGFTSTRLTCVYGRTVDNRVYFGGSAGFYYYDPGLEAGIKSQNEGDLRFTGFALSNGNDGRNQQLMATLNKSASLSLQHDENSFVVSFSYLSSEIAPSHNYFYRIEGLSDEWVYLGNENQIALTYLRPGVYDLSVKVLLDGDREVVRRLLIDIAAPWWNTGWFRVGLLVVILLLVAIIIRWRMREMRSTQQRLRSEVKAATEEILLQQHQVEEQNQNLALALEDTNRAIDEAVTSGNLEARIDLSGKQGKWLALADSINRLFDSITNPLNMLNHLVRAMKHGDLSQRFTGDVKGDLAELSDNFNASLESLTALLQDIQLKSEIIHIKAREMELVSSTVREATSSINSSITEISMGANTQVTQVDRSSTLIDNVRKEAEEIEDLSEQINNLAQKGHASCQEGQIAVDTMDGGIKATTGLSKESLSAVQQLQEQSRSVKSVLSLLRDIAEQTHRLALNAAIQAAQAGEHGRGFSVVAEQVRKLAEHSNESVGEIDAILGGMEEGAAQVATKMEQMVTAVAESNEHSSLSATAFATIAKSYDETLGLSTKIIEAVKGQASSIQELVGFVEGVVVISEETAAGASETKAAMGTLFSSVEDYDERANEYSKISADLQSKLALFRLNEPVENGQNG